ncbi:MAG: aminotransferase class I/II-fold pyridoxal phosphate-dependent enzyme [Acidobacteria bacterium]|nr:MAG: aminotransferase class I/II-fold pyridoxal phosphate-dependent enzyme [Acidobacteriota bacterium]
MAESPNNRHPVSATHREQPGEVSATVIRLDKNENPFDVPRAIKDEILRRLATLPWSRFPEPRPEGVVERLAAFNHCGPDHVVVGNGSSQLLQLLLEVVTDGPTRILVPEPTVGPLSSIAQMVNADIVGVPMTEALQFNVPKLCSRAVAMKVEMVIIGSPHDPTGCVMAESDLVTLLNTSPGIVVVDESYYEFAHKTFAPLVVKYPRLVILRTFSIALGLAGWRIGYLLTSPDLARRINERMLPGSISTVSALAAEVAIDMHDHFRAQIEKLVSERERVYSALRRMNGVKPVPSHANFMVVRTDLTGRQLCQLLRERNILVHDLSGHPTLTNAIRVSIGAPQENDHFLAAMEEIFSG